jgi:hypothetical protein
MKSPLLSPLFATVFLVSTITADSQTKSPTSSPTGSKPRSSPSAASGGSPTPSGTFSQQAYREAVDILKQRIGAASDKVMPRIAAQEQDVRNRFSYFQKPERLDPNSFGAKEEIDPWRSLLDDFKKSRDLAVKLYLDADADLDNALINQHLTRQIADPIRKELVSTFPWESINKRNQLLETYIEAHRALLDFYDQHWGTWTKGNETGKPVFADTKLAAAYQELRDKVSSLGKQIDDLNAKILR